MVVESCDDAVVIIAEHVLDELFRLELVSIRRRLRRTSRAASDVHHRLAKGVTSARESAPIVGRQSAVGWQLQPSLNVLITETGFVDGVLPEMKVIPRLATGRAIHVHGFAVR